MTPPTVTLEEMVSYLDAEFQHCSVSFALNIGDNNRRRDAEVFAASRDFIQSRAAQDAATKASAEDALNLWWHEDHFGEKCEFDDQKGGVSVHSEECVSTSFMDGYAAGRYHSTAELLAASGQGLAAKDQRIAELEQTSGELCSICGWRGIRGDACAFCRVAELEREVAELRAVTGPKCVCSHYRNQRSR